MYQTIEVKDLYKEEEINRIDRNMLITLDRIKVIEDEMGKFARIMFEELEHEIMDVFDTHGADVGDMLSSIENQSNNQGACTQFIMTEEGISLRIVSIKNLAAFDIQKATSIHIDNTPEMKNMDGVDGVFGPYPITKLWDHQFNFRLMVTIIRTTIESLRPKNCRKCRK